MKAIDQKGQDPDPAGGDPGLLDRMAGHHQDDSKSSGDINLPISDLLPCHFPILRKYSAQPVFLPVKKPKNAPLRAPA